MTLFDANIKYKLNELHLYGSSRLGIHKADTMFCSFDVEHYFNAFDSTWKAVTYTPQCTTTTNTNYIELSRIRGKRFYELTNHLGNPEVSGQAVLTTITDRKLPIDDPTTGIDTVLYFNADIVGAILSIWDVAGGEEF